MKVQKQKAKIKSNQLLTQQQQSRSIYLLVRQRSNAHKRCGVFGSGTVQKVGVNLLEKVGVAYTDGFSVLVPRHMGDESDDEIDDESLRLRLDRARIKSLLASKDESDDESDESDDESDSSDDESDSSDDESSGKQWNRGAPAPSPAGRCK